jgi:hypothetical protein
LLAERFARQRLNAVARVEGKISDGKPTVLFLCTHKAGRSHLAGERLPKKMFELLGGRLTGGLPLVFIPSRTQTADSRVAWTPEPGTFPRPFGGLCRWRFEVGPGQ